MTNLLRLVCLDASVLTAQTQILAGNSVPIKPDIRPSERNAITYPLYPVDVGSAKPACTYWCPCSGSTKWVLPNRIRNHRFNQHGGLRTRGWQKLQKRQEPTPSTFSIPEPLKKNQKRSKFLVLAAFLRLIASNQTIAQPGIPVSTSTLRRVSCVREMQST